MKTIFLNVGLIVLTIFFIWKGLIPAYTSLQTDFPNYYTSSRLVLEGNHFEKFYDDVWFQEQIHRFGINEQGKFSPFPPLTTLVFLPIAKLEPLLAKQIWTTINLLLLVFNIVLVSSILKTNWKIPLLIFLLSGLALINNFRFGQLYLLLTFTITLGYYLFTQNEKTLSGIMFGLFIPIKYFPLIYIVYFAFKREWKVVNAAL